MRAFPAFLLVMIAMPQIAAAAMIVTDPTGDADPAFLAELKASLETVAAEAPAELNAELRSRATVTDAGVELVVELVPIDGSAPVRETRIVSKASALSQARAMARDALRTLAAPAGVATTAPKVVVVQEKPTASQPAPLPQKYDRRKALRMTVLPTVLLPLIGGGIIPLGFLALGSNNQLYLACIISGSTLAATGLIFGPSTGYFWIGRWGHALAMSGLRLALFGTGVTSLFMYLAGSWCDYDENCSANPMWLVLSVTSLTAAFLTAYIDAALVGRGADRANEQFRKSLQVTVAPVVWTDGNGQKTYGLALSGSF